MLLLGREEEILEELRGSEMLATTHVDIFSDVLHNIDHLLLLVKLQPFLREIAKAHGISNVEAPAIQWLHAEEHPNKGRFTRTVVANNTQLLETGEVIIEVLQDYLIAKSLGDILALEDFAADIDIS